MSFLNQAPEQLASGGGPGEGRKQGSRNPGVYIKGAVSVMKMEKEF